MAENDAEDNDLDEDVPETRSAREKGDGTDPEGTVASSETDSGAAASVRDRDGDTGGAHGLTGRRTAVAGTIAVVLLGAVLTPVGRDIYGSTGDALDGVRDFFRSFDGKEVDNLKEYVEESEDWVGEPQIFDESFAFLVDHPDANLARVSGNSLAVLTVSNVIDDAPKYVGTPVFLVAEVIERRAVPIEEDGESSEELLVSDSTNEDFAYVGAGGPTFSDADGARAGAIIVARGLVMASGLAKYEGSRPFRTVYFTSQDITRAGLFGGPFAKEIRDRIQAFDRR